MDLFVHQDLLMFDKVSKNFVIFKYNEKLDGKMLALLFPFNLAINPLYRSDRNFEAQATTNGTELILKAISKFQVGK